MAETRIPAKQIDWSSFALNAKSAINASSISPSNTGNNFASSVAITFTVETASAALVTISVGTTSTTDFEMQPTIYLDGTLVASFTPQAGTGNASGRALVRGFTAAITLSAGAHTISPGCGYSAGTSLSISAGGVSIGAIVLGNVTA